MLLQHPHLEVARGGLPSLNELLAATTPKLAFGLAVIGDLFWLVVYILAIRIAVRQKTYAIPAAAVVLNFTWEFVYSVIYPPPNLVDLIANLAWLGLDLVIVIQLFRHGDPGSRKTAQGKWFAAAVVGSLGLALVGHITFYEHTTANAIFPDRGGVTEAYLINLLMSLLFIGMFYRRPDGRGISKGIAWAKFLGTGFVSLANVLSIRALPHLSYEVQYRVARDEAWISAGTIGSHTIHPGFFYFLFGATLLADLIYLVLVTIRRRPST